MAHIYDDDPYDDNPAYCSTCGREVDATARFCDNCGAVIDPQAGAPQYTPGMPYFDQGAQHVEYMGFWIRLGALAIDTILLTIVNLILRFAVGDGGVGFLINLVVNFGYAVILTAWRGQTVGKMVVGIQVVDSQGNIPGIGAVLLREVVGKFLSAIAIGLGYLWVAWDKEKRGWHDHIAGTYVVRKQQGHEPY